MNLFMSVIVLLLLIVAAICFLYGFLLNKLDFLLFGGIILLIYTITLKKNN